MQVMKEVQIHLDEIDGAPAASIDLLLKFIQGKLIPKGKKR